MFVLNQSACQKELEIDRFRERQKDFARRKEGERGEKRARVKSVRMTKIEEKEKRNESKKDTNFVLMSLS